MECGVESGPGGMGWGWPWTQRAALTELAFGSRGPLSTSVQSPWKVRVAMYLCMYVCMYRVQSTAAMIASRRTASPYVANCCLFVSRTFFFSAFLVFLSSFLSFFYVFLLLFIFFLDALPLPGNAGGCSLVDGRAGPGSTDKVSPSITEQRSQSTNPTTLDLVTTMYITLGQGFCTRNGLAQRGFDEYVTHLTDQVSSPCNTFPYDFKWD